MIRLALLLSILGAGAAGAADAATLVYVNRCNPTCTYTGTAADDSSANTTTVFSGTRNFAAYQHGDASFTAVVDCLATLLAPFDIDVVTVDPGATPHHELVLGGTPQNAGLPSGIGGIAPAQCSYIPKAPAFVFANGFPDNPQFFCDAAGQQLGSIAGLEPLYDCRDAMSFLPSCGARSFLDQATQCGGNMPAACMCGGTTRNSYAFMRAAFGGADALFLDGFE